MTETAGKLYIHTCHEMYTSSDGLNHQANMTFVLDENTLKVLDSYSDVMNLVQAGYVSHSFNQFICTDGKSVYRVDHGDANPRAVAITKCDVDGKSQMSDTIMPIPFLAGSETMPPVFLSADLPFQNKTASLPEIL